MSSLHSQSLKEKWDKLSLFEQMGNIGSEVGRSISSINKDTAFDRAVELFDITLTDPRWAWPKMKEIARARESFLESYTSNDISSLNSLDKYFYYFALAARIQK